MNRIPVASSNIYSVGYENGNLEIQFLNGWIYLYPNVPRKHFDYMISHAHPGTYFKRYVEPFYRYTEKHR